MKRLNTLHWVLSAALLVGPTATAHAAIVLSGDVDPTDSADWNSDTDGTVGLNNLGSLQVNGGSNLDSRYGYIGYNASATGQATIDGAGSMWTNAGILVVGHSGNGSLDVTAGAAVADSSGYVGRYAGATGQATIDGPDSSWTNGTLYVGHSGNGSLDVGAGGTVASGSAYIGYNASGTGEAAVDGAQSTWTNTGNLSIGYSGNGSLDVTAGASVTNSHGYLGFNADAAGLATVDGAGSTWTSTGTLSVGHSGSGTLQVTGGATLANNVGQIGYDATAAGTVTVDGASSAWTNSGDLYIGYSGSGTIEIGTAGAVSTAGSTWVAYETGSTGLIDFGTDGGTLGTRTVAFSSPGQLTGTGTINTRGLVSDLALVFDSTHGLTQTISLAGLPDQEVTLNLDMSGDAATVGNLGAGYHGAGSLSIQEGIAVASVLGYVGYAPGSTGSAAVAGAGSTWTNHNDLYIGRSGGGTLDVTAAATVRNDQGYVGYNPGATGLVSVDGAGSTWTNDNQLYIGHSGDATLAITDSAIVDNAAGYVAYGAASTGHVTVDGAGSTWLNTSSLFVGRHGNATLDVTGAATVSDTYASIAQYADATATATVHGIGSTWIHSSDLEVGSYGNGTLNVTDGGAVSDSNGYVGRYANSTGTATVDGAASRWTNSANLHVGYSGNGTLNITNGAAVSVGGSTYIAHEPSATGLIDFGTNGGSLTTRTLLVASPVQLMGTGTVTTRGLISDLNLEFDAAHPASHPITLAGQTGQEVTLNLDLSGSASFLGNLGVGYRSNGSLSIKDAVAIESASGYVGYDPGSAGEVVVDGAGSTWTTDTNLHVGFSGTGTLALTAAGAVRNAQSYIGYNAASAGMATVDGVGSQWTNIGNLYVGHYGTGRLTITGAAVARNANGYVAAQNETTAQATVDGPGSRWINSGNLTVGRYSGTATLHVAGGAAVTAASVSINSESLLAIDAGRGSSLTVNGGSGTIDNDGLVRILAGAGVAAGGVYSPFAAATWTGQGIVQAVGGTWSQTSHAFTVSPVVSGESGAMQNIDLALVQRLLVADNATGWSLGASLLAADLPTTLDFTATALDLASLGHLALLLDPEESVRGGWSFNVAGAAYASAEPAYLSFDVGAGFARSDLNVWHFDGLQWAAFDAVDLTYDGQYASFTVNGFSGYAVSGFAGPERQWAQTSGGSYNEPSNWTDSIVPDGVNAVASFLERIANPSTVTVDAPVTVGTILFDNINTYTIAGPALITLERSDGPAEIDVLAGDHTISAPVAMPGGLLVDAHDGTRLTLSPPSLPVITLVSSNLTKRGGGTWTVGGGLALIGDLDVEQGTLQIAADLLALPGGAVNVAEDATLEVSGSVNRRIAGVPGSILAAAGPTDIGISSATDGYDFQGSLNVGPHAVGLKDADWANVYRGATLAGGRLSSFYGIDVQGGSVFSPTIKGFGTIDGAVHLNGGAIAGASTTQPIVLSGIVSGVGSLRNVQITGLARLGNSPAYTPVANLWAATMEFDLQGTASGAAWFDPTLNDGNGDIVFLGGDYDQLGAFGPVDLDGTMLKVSLPDDFVPNPATDAFLLFDHIEMPEGLGEPGVYRDWFAYVALPPQMSAGDWHWRFTYADGTTSEGQAPLADFTYGVLTAGAIVPEPGTLVLLLAGMVGVLAFGRRNTLALLAFSRRNKG